MVYLLHFHKPVGGRAWHYLGYCKDGELDRRLAIHRSGNGARIMRAAVEQGIGWTVALTLVGDRKLERELKRKKHASRFCPICKMGA
jgi:predicted GIY-YIG superfamily endonuclease